jgi:hypothetical protein
MVETQHRWAFPDRINGRVVCVAKRNFDYETLQNSTALRPKTAVFAELTSYQFQFASKHANAVQR